MRGLRAFLLRLAAVFRRENWEEDLDAEIKSNLELHVEDCIRAGMTPEQARRQARLKFGNVELVKEDCRDRRGLPALETSLRDVRYGFQTLLRNPGFTAVAVLTLALGIGANTAIFSAVSAVLYREIPFEDPERLLHIYETFAERGTNAGPVSLPNYADIRDNSQAFGQLAASQGLRYTLSGAGGPDTTWATRVSPQFFQVLRKKAVLGRTFIEEDYEAGAERVVVLTHGFWKRYFGAEDNVIGQTIKLNREVHTIVGVIPPELRWSGEWYGDFFTPLELKPREETNRALRLLGVIARLRPAVSREQAQAELDVLAKQLAQQYPQTNKGYGLGLVTFPENQARSLGAALFVLQGVVVFVLLIACVNVTNLLLGRAATRRKEMAVRAAMGAGRGRLVRQMLTESFLLAAMGGTLPIVFALLGFDVLELLGAVVPGLPSDRLALDYRVLGFTAAVSVLTALLVGLAPAMSIKKQSVGASLKTGWAGWQSGSHRHPLRSLLVVSEVALTLVLLVAAGLMLRSFLRLQGVDPGFNPDKVLTIRMSLPTTVYSDAPKVRSFVQRVLERVEGLPGVESMGAASFLPFTNFLTSRIKIEGRLPPASGEEPSVGYQVINPSYFQPLQIPLMRGRGFDERDNIGAPGVAIINETMARRFWPDQDPLGQFITVLTGLPSDYGEPSTHQIVGIVGYVRHTSLEKEPPAQMYVPYLQKPYPIVDLAVRSQSDFETLAAAIRSEVQAVDRDQPVYWIRTLNEIVESQLAGRRIYGSLLGIFAAIAAALAAAGIYGVISYVVAERTHELGIRSALGAQRRDLLKLVLGRGLRLTLLGIGVGVASSIALTRLISHQLYGVTPTDPITFAVAGLAIIGLAMLACYIPAHRATQVDPLVALRHD